MTSIRNLVFFTILIVGSAIAAGVAQNSSQSLPVKSVAFQLDGLSVASVEDATGSTGASLFYFPDGALVQTDIRGGSAGTSETTLFEPGSYSIGINAVVFAGGSTMGLAAGDGVREAIFKQRSQSKLDFDMIPSVPTAVVYDFEMPRRFPGKSEFAYPDRLMGLELMKRLSDNSFVVGRAGAGVSTTSNKFKKRVWGGQGAAVRDLGYAKVFAAVVVNAVGELNVPGLKPIPGQVEAKPKPGSNTTLSIVVTDLKLSRNALKRMAVMVHTGMARSIFPFHSFYDGDSHFSVSTRKRDMPSGKDEIEVFMELQMAASEAMQSAIEISAITANSQN